MLSGESKQIHFRVALILLTIALISGFLAQAGTIAAADGNILRELVAPLPDYPKSAWEKGRDGEVTLKFDVTEEGYVEDPCIVESTLPGQFELYALRAMRDHRYEQLGGPVQRIEGVTKRFSFTLDSNPIVPIKVKYPRPALERGEEGYVVVQFGVTARGTVSDQVVVKADPIDFFEEAALAAASKMKFERTRFKPDHKILHKFTFSLDSRPQEAVVPEYPDAAKVHQIYGHVIVEFNINADGKVENPKAIYSDASVLEPAAISAVSKFTYDQNKPAQGVLHKIDFHLNQDWQALTKVEPEYPRQALLDGVEGYVILRFIINEQGSVEQPKVIEAKPKGVFDDSALTAAKQDKYIPKYVDGKPTKVESVHQRVLYVIEGTEGQSPGRALDESSPIAQLRHPRFRHTLKPTHTLYIQDSLDDGSVIVEFDVNEHGFVEQLKILEVQDTTLSHGVTLRILEEVGYYKYTPLVIDDVRVSTYRVRHRIELRFHEE